jgi:metal transporter CNNM
MESHLGHSHLQVVAEAGKPDDSKYAKQIMPLRNRGNQLLCTLIIGNVVVNSYLSILLARVTGGVLGLITSTSLIVLFGEILPQAICSRYGLFFGASTRHVTWFVMVCLWAVAWPISKGLDCMLGKEVGTIYSRDELKQLLQLHAAAEAGSGGIDVEDHNLLAGA